MPRIISLAYCEACQVVEKGDERRARSTITASIPARRGHSAFHHTTSLTRPGGLHRTGMEHGEGGRFSSVAQAALLGAQRTPGRKTIMRKPHCICCSPFLSLARGAHFRRSCRSMFHGCAYSRVPVFSCVLWAWELKRAGLSEQAGTHLSNNGPRR
jgi:hypothetical protein